MKLYAERDGEQTLVAEVGDLEAAAAEVARRQALWLEGQAENNCPLSLEAWPEGSDAVVVSSDGKSSWVMDGYNDLWTPT